MEAVDVVLVVEEVGKAVVVVHHILVLLEVYLAFLAFVRESGQEFDLEPGLVVAVVERDIVQEIVGEHEVVEDIDLVFPVALEDVVVDEVEQVLLPVLSLVVQGHAGRSFHQPNPSVAKLGRLHMPVVVELEEFLVFCQVLILPTTSSV